MLDLEAASRLDLELDLELDLALNLEADPTSLSGGSAGGGGSGQLMVALGAFAPASRMESAVNGGEAGLSTSWGVISMFRVKAFTPALPHQRIVSRGTGNAGWGHYLLTTGQLICYVADAGTYKHGGAVQLSNSDLGRIILFLSWTDASGVMRCAVHRLEARAVGNTMVTYSVPTGYTHCLGADPNVPLNPATTIDVLSHLSFSGVPSDAQFQAVFDAARARGDLPDTIDGGALRHRWSLRDELRGVQNPVGRKTYGARSFSSAAYFEAANALPGSNQFWFASLTRLDQALSSANGKVAGKSAYGAGGWQQAYAAAGVTGLFHDGVGTPRASSVIPAASFPVGGGLNLLVHVLTGTVIKTYALDGSQQGADASCTGYTAHASAFRLGMATTVGADSAAALTAFGFAGGNGVPTPAQVKQLFVDVETTGRIQAIAGLTDVLYDPDLDIVANGGAMPTTIVNRANPGTNNLTRTGTLEVAVDVAKAPPCPAQLTDTVTRAPVDALARVGAPQVVTIDPTIDGRRTLGAQGCETANFLQSDLGAGIRGSADFAVGWFGRLDALVNATAGVLAEAYAGAGGWLLVANAANNGNIGFSAFDGGGVQRNSGSVFAPAASDLSVPIMLVGQVSGGVLRFFIKRPGASLSQLGADVACVGFTAASAGTRMMVGCRSGNAFPSRNVSHFGLGGGNGARTLAELSAWADEVVDKQGRMVALPGGATGGHFYDLTTDILASGVDAVPAQVLDRVGTDHLTRVGIDVQTGPNAIRGVGPYGATDGWVTAAGGGIQGANSGFHIGFDLYLTKIPTAREFLALCADSGIATSGWYVDFTPPALRFVIVNIQSSSTYTITAADLNKRLRVVMQKTATQLQLFVQGAQVGADAAAATIATNAANAMRIGNLNNANSLSCGWIENVHGGNTVLTPAEITAQSADLTQPPPITAGKTQKRWRFEQDIAAVSGALPVRSVERISGSDDLMRIGSGLTLAQRTERLWSYETSPIMQCGASSGAGANRWEGAPSLDTGGSAAGFFLGLMLRSKGTANARLLSHSAGGPQGWNVTGNAGVLVGFNFVDGSGVNRSAPSITVPAGKAACVMATLDGATIKGFHNRVQVGASTTCVGYGATSIGALGPTLGSLYGGSSPNPDWEVFGWVMGYALPSLAEFGAWEDACMALDDIAELGGSKSAHLYSFKRGRSGNRLLDLIGTAHMEPVGAPVVTDVYGRAYAR